MKRNQLKALGVPDEVIGDVLDALHEAIKNAETTVTNKLNGEIETLKTDLKAAKEENASIIDKYDKDQESYKNKYEAEVELRKKAETDLTTERTANEAYRNEIKTEKETAAKQETFLDAVASFESKDTKAKLNPKQVAEFAKSYGGEVEWETLKDGSFKMKNFDAVMSGGMKNEAYEFKAPETRTAQTGFFSPTTQNKISGKSMNDFIRAGASGQPITDD